MFGRNKNIGKLNQKLSKINANWFVVRKDIEKAIKKNGLTDDLVKNYLKASKSYTSFVMENRGKLIKENPLLDQKKCLGLVKDMNIHIKWCLKELTLRKCIVDVESTYKKTKVTD